MSQVPNPIEGPQSEAKLRRQVKAGFALAIMLTCLLSFLSWRMARQATADAAWVARTHEMSTTLEAALRHLVDAGSGGQGFALTGSEPFLDPYEAGKYAVGQDLLRLRRLITDAGQQRELNRLEQQANLRIEAAEESVTARQDIGESPSEAELKREEALTEAARGTVAEMESAQARLLEVRTGRARGTQRFNLYLIALGALAGVIFLSLAGVTVHREIAVNGRARSQVIALNEDLERRVEQRTEALEEEIAIRVESDARLRESEGRLARILQSAMDAIITVDEEQRIVLFNRAAETMFLCPASEAVGQSITRWIPQCFHAAHNGHVRNFGETGISNRPTGPRDVLWAVRADGEEFQIETSISQAAIGGKKLFTVIIRDVTERLRAQAVREHLALVVDSSDDAIISQDLNGVINAWNRGAEKIFGYAAAEGLSQPMLMIFPPDRVHEDSHILARIGRGESVEHFETVRVRKDGARIDVSMTISPMRDGNGAMVGASTIARDITEKKAAELEIRKLNESLEERIAQRTAQLEAANHELEAFTYSVSHDLRAPLRRILGFAGAFLEEFGSTLDPQALHYLQRIQEGTRRMGVLTDELLNLARTGQKALRLQSTDLIAVVEEVIVLLQGETDGRQVEWRIGSLPAVECDPVLVRQIFQNLLSNAIKYSRPRAHAIIEIGHRRENDVPVIFVRDNGVGFNMQYADKLFGVFQRLHSDEEFEGTGIGLATVARIVHKHGGRIWAEAELGQGATFYFTLSGKDSSRLDGDPVTAAAGSRLRS